MQKAHENINWEDFPSVNTPLCQRLLNKNDRSVDVIDDRVVAMDTTKANQSDLLTAVKTITYNSATGTFTVTFFNNTTVTIDTDIEKIPVNFDYDDDPTSPHYQQLILELDDGTFKYIDLSALITEYEFQTSNTIQPIVSGGNVAFEIINGSVTDQKLQPNYLADITAQAGRSETAMESAEEDAGNAEAWAVGTIDGDPVPASHPAYQNNSYWWSQHGEATSISAMTDVALSGLTDGEVLVYSRQAQKWVNQMPLADSLVNLTDVTVSNLQDGEILKYNASTQKWNNAEDAGGAMPHLIIISETGSVVTATRGATVITATETSTGHYECDLTEVNGTWFGTWVIDAILGGDDAQVSLLVDKVQVYTVDDSHFHADITVTYPTGATVSCTMAGETPMYAIESPYTFVVHQSGTWTITGTRNGITETQTVVITTSGQEESVTLTILPDGSTVTPTDDVQTLLNCADIWDKTTYTTIADLIADDASLLEVLTSDNAIDYLVRSTTFASAITADEDAMAMIGSYDYASDTLLSDSTWATAIGGSAYATSVLNISVPTMTSNTTPKGEVFCDSAYSTEFDGWKAFDKNNTTAWSSNKTGTTNINAYVGYKFINPVIVCKTIWRTYWTSTQTITGVNVKIQGSNDGFVSDIHDLHTETIASLTINTDYTFKFNNATAYQYYRLLFVNATHTTTYVGWTSELNFYGRENGGVQSWLRAGGITDKDYTTLAEVLADTTTLSALIADHDAVDYLVTAKAFIDGIVADATAMSYIGLNNYCANTLLADADWLEAICNSTYMESVLNVKVPTMTSDTTPSGEVLYSTQYNASEYAGWRAFDNNPSTEWASTLNSYSNQYIGYDFKNSVKIFAFSIQNTPQGSQYGSTYPFRDIKLQAYDSTWEDIQSYTNPSGSSVKTIFIIDEPIESEKFRIYGSAYGTSLVSTAEIQFYGREDV